MQGLTAKQEAALAVMRDMIAEARSYPTAEAYTAKYEGEYEKTCAWIRWNRAQRNTVNFTNLDHQSGTIRELADMGLIRILSEERQDFNIDLFVLEILQ